MANQLKVGDVVQLKGGGPILTVIRVGEDKGGSNIGTVWHEGAKEYRASYPAAALEIYEEEDPPMPTMG